MAGPVRLLQAMIWLFFGLLLLMSPFIAVLALIGLLPTIVLLLADSSPRKESRLSAMFAFNLCGVLPFLTRLWDDGPSLDNLLRHLGDVMVWVVMYGAAGVGSAMLWICPIFAAAILQWLNQEKAAKLEKQRSRLLEEWGEPLARTSMRASDTSRQGGEGAAA